MANEHDAPATGTGTLAAARNHPRQQAGSGHDSGPQVPSGSVALPADADRARPVWAEPIPPFGYASRRLARGTVFRVTDPVGTACVQLLVHNAATGGAAQRGRHGQGPVAGLPRRRRRAAVGHGSGDDDARRRHQRPPRLPLRRSTGRQRGPYGDGATWADADRPRPPGARAMKLGLDRRDVGPNVNLFRPRRRRPRRLAPPRRRPRPGATSSSVPRCARRSSPTRPTPWTRTSDTPRGALPGVVPVAGARRRPTVPIVASPERARAYLNTDELPGRAS